MHGQARPIRALKGFPATEIANADSGNVHVLLYGTVDACSDTSSSHMPYTPQQAPTSSLRAELCARPYPSAVSLSSAAAARSTTGFSRRFRALRAGSSRAVGFSRVANIAAGKETEWHFRGVFQSCIASEAGIWWKRVSLVRAATVWQLLCGSSQCLGVLKVPSSWSIACDAALLKEATPHTSYRLPA